MNIKIIAVGVIALVAGLGAGYLLGSAGKSEPLMHDMSMAMNGMASGLENKEGSDFDRAFIDEMIVHHEGAVDMARMVLEKSQRPELLKLANEIISAQTAEIDLMNAWKIEWFGSGMHHVQ